MNSNNNGPEVNVKDLCYFLLRKLWIMLIVGAILAAALGGFKVSRRAKTYDILDISTKLSNSESDEQYLLRVQNISKARGYYEMISRVNSQIENQRQYLSDSIYMQIDADNVYQSSALVSITISNNNANGTENFILAAYEREIKASAALDAYAREQNIKTEYLKELISFSPFVPNNTINNEDSSFRISALNIYVIGPNSEMCDDIMNLILKELDSLYVDVCTSVVSHDVSVVGVQNTVLINEDVRNGQNNRLGRIDNLQKQINSYYDSLDKIAKELGLSGKNEIIEYFDSHEEETVNEIPTLTSEKKVSILTMIKPAAKYSALGFIAGFAIIAVVFIFRYLFGKTFSTQAQFFSEFSSIIKIGVLKPTSKRSNYCRFIDFASEDDTKLSAENNNRLISYNYNNLLGEKTKILITGMGDSEVMQNTVNLLALKGDFKPNMFCNPDILMSIHNYEAIVLIEQRDYSKFRDVKNEISLITNTGIEILGAIII